MCYQCSAHFEDLLFDEEALNITTIQVFGRCHGKDNGSLMVFFYGDRKKKKLTALVALDHNVFDGQQATLPRGYGFKHNLRRREETHNTNDKWPHLQMALEWGRREKSSSSIMQSPLSQAADGHTAAGHWCYLHNMSRLKHVMTCKH